MLLCKIKKKAQVGNYRLLSLPFVKSNILDSSVKDIIAGHLEKFKPIRKFNLVSSQELCLTNLLEIHGGVISAVDKKEMLHVLRFPQGIVQDNKLAGIEHLQKCAHLIRFKSRVIKQQDRRLRCLDF